MLVQEASRSERKDAVSIFDRLISTLTGGDAAAAPGPAAAEDGDGKRSRFMARDDADAQSQPAPVVEKGFEAPSEIWLHVHPHTQRLLLVAELGEAQGQELNATMQSDLVRAGLCEEVAYHASYDQYWKMPSQEAILRTPSLFHIAAPLMHKIKLETRLVKHGEARGFWMRVRIRDAAELAAQA